MKKILFMLLMFLTASSCFWNEVNNEKLKVIIKNVEPFVFENNKWFSIDLLNNITKKLWKEYEITKVSSVGEIIDWVNKNQDIWIAAITVNAERMEKVSFSLPMYSSGLQIMTGNNNKSYVSKDLIYSILSMVWFLLFCIVVLAHLIWVVERNRNPWFHKSYKKWIVDWIRFWSTSLYFGFWNKWELEPITRRWRIITTFWVIFLIFMIAYFTSTVTSQLTVSQINWAINSINDLPWKKVATVKSTTSSKFLKTEWIEYIWYSNINEAIKDLESWKITALVYDAPVLQYYVKNKWKGKVKIVWKVFKKEDYWIAVDPKNRELLDKINIELQKIKENGEYELLYNKYF